MEAFLGVIQDGNNVTPQFLKYMVWRLSETQHNSLSVLGWVHAKICVLSRHVYIVFTSNQPIMMSILVYCSRYA